MTSRRQMIVAEPEAEARRIVEAAESDLRAYVHAGVLERWLSTLVEALNRLEQSPTSQRLARRALRRLGFPVAE